MTGRWVAGLGALLAAMWLGTANARADWLADITGPPEPALLSLDTGLSRQESLTYVTWPYHQSMQEHSRRIIGQALKLADGNQTKAAERLCLQRTYLARLIKQQKMRQEEAGLRNSVDQPAVRPAYGRIIE